MLGFISVATFIARWFFLTRLEKIQRAQLAQSQSDVGERVFTFSARRAEIVSGCIDSCSASRRTGIAAQTTRGLSKLSLFAFFAFVTSIDVFKFPRAAFQTTGAADSRLLKTGGA
jgi:hypothetical protein